MTLQGLSQRLITIAVTALGLIVVWQMVVVITDVPTFILPGPARVFETLLTSYPLILGHAGTTLLEIVLGLILGTIFGGASALLITLYKPVHRWLMPLLVISQALPVFALAPLLTLWFGYGMGSKVAMACLIIFFPVTAAFHDGLRRVDPSWLDMAKVMGGSKFMQLRLIRLPAALPAFGSGLRVATAVAPIGAVVGEWVGASSGLGYLMLHANARMQTDLMFASLFVLAVLALLLYALVDFSMKRLVTWMPEDGHG